MTQDGLALHLGLSDAQVSRIVRGASLASTLTAERIREITGGLVTPLDLHETRLGWLRAHGQWPPAEAARAA